MSRKSTIAVYQRPMFELIRTAKELHAKIEQYGKKTEQLQMTLGLTLKEAKERKPKGITWPAFVKKHFNFGRSRADELIQIADGRTTVETVRANTAARVQKYAAKSPLANGGSTPAGTSTISIMRGPNRPLIPTRTIPATVTYKTLRIAAPYTRLPPNEPVESPAVLPRRDDRRTARVKLKELEAAGTPCAPAIGPADPDASKKDRMPFDDLVAMTETDPTWPSIIEDVGAAELHRIILMLQAVYEAHCESSAVKLAADRAEARLNAEATS
jgi:hypothetical protein